MVSLENRFFLIFAFIVLIVAVPLYSLANGPYYCGDNGFTYNSQTLCNANCSHTCEQLTPATEGSTGTCDTGNYEGFVYDPDTQHTYAVTKGTGFWTSYKSNLAIIRDAETNQLLESILKQYSIGGAWIGAYDPNMSTNYNTVDASRFVWGDNTTITYSNWHHGEPNNVLFSQDEGIVPFYGEHWVEMYSDGTWNDLGYHYLYPSSRNYAPYLHALVQWYGKLSCVDGAPTSTNPTQSQAINSITSQYCSGQTPCYMCSDTSSCINGGQCPSGYTYNSQDGNCQAPATCPSGGTASSDTCYANVEHVCPSGYTYSSQNGDCESQPSIVCPSGSSYNTSLKECEISPSGGSCPGSFALSPDRTECYSNPTYQCPSGGSWNGTACSASVSERCPSGYTLANGICTAQPTCPGDDYTGIENGECITDLEPCAASSSTLRECVKTNEGYFCPLGDEKCIAKITSVNPTCPSGGTLDTTLHKCTAQPNPTCPSGYTYDSSIDRCTAPAQCPDGGSLNPYTDKCEIVITSSMCPSGYTYNTTYEACVKTPTCPSGGTYNPSRDRCEYQVTKSCPSGYTYDSSKDICEANPQCPGGTSYNATYNKCLVSANLTCPSGYTQSGGKCVANPQCPSGSSYNASTNRCEMAAGASFGSGNSCVNFDSVTNCLEFSNGNVRTFTHGNSNSYGQWISLSSSTASESSSNVGLFGDLRVYASNYELFINSSSPKVSLISGGDTGKVILSAYVISGYCYEDWCSYIAAAKIEDIQASNGKVRLGVTGSEGVGTSPSEAVSNAITEARIRSISWGSWVSVYTPSCPSGWTLSGPICYKPATCPTGGSLNTSDDKCEVPLQTNCPSGTTYDSSINYCTASVTCPNGGSLNTSTDKCQISVTNECPSDYTYDSSTNLCYSSPICDYGYYDSSINLCRLSASNVCPSGYTFDNATNKCLENPQCQSPGQYSDTLNECGATASYNCPSGYSYNSGDKLCEAKPQCSEGSFNSSDNKCEYTAYQCPYGSQYKCYDYNGAKYCSKDSCTEVDNATGSLQIVNDNTTQDKQPNGKVTSSGCEGTVYIFNGSTHRCRKAGIETGWSNCCRKSKDWFGLGRCKPSEVKLAKMRDAGLCHYVGSYCAVKFLGVCLQKKESFCCFHSVLGRIVQEQARETQGIPYSGWGKAKDPVCWGFTPDQFQALDWSKVDLSEYYSYIEKKVVPQATENAQKAVKNASQKIQNSMQNMFSK